MNSTIYSALIVGNVELAMDDVPDWNPSRKNLEEIQKAGLRARDVIRQLLSFSRKREENFMPMNPMPIIKESIKLLRSSIPSIVEFHQNYPKQCHTILGDPTQIHQIMINLVTNAYHSMQNDGGVIKIELKNIKLENELVSFDFKIPAGNYVQLTISDTGHGIPEDCTGKNIRSVLYNQRRRGKDRGWDFPSSTAS